MNSQNIDLALWGIIIAASIVWAVSAYALHAESQTLNDEDADQWQSSTAAIRLLLFFSRATVCVVALAAVLHWIGLL